MYIRKSIVGQTVASRCGTLAWEVIRVDPDEHVVDGRLAIRLVLERMNDAELSAQKLRRVKTVLLHLHKPDDPIAQEGAIEIVPVESQDNLRESVVVVALVSFLFLYSRWYKVDPSRVP